MTAPLDREQIERGEQLGLRKWLSKGRLDRRRGADQKGMGSGREKVPREREYRHPDRLWATD